MELGSIPRETLVLVAAIAVLVAVVQATAVWLGRFRRRRRMTLRFERAAAGEERAPERLAEHGYRVLGAQVVAEHQVQVDDRVVVIALRADYLVEKRGARYVVEVKTGALAPRIETSATRRQMLEYRVAFDVDGVVLVDAESGGVHEVTFPSLARFASAHPSRVGWRVAAVVACAALMIVAVVRFV